MPTPSNPPTHTTVIPAYRRMPRILRAGRILKILTTLLILTFVCTCARTAFRYGSPRPLTTASITKPSPQTFFTPTHTRPNRRRPIFRPAHQLKRHARRTKPFYLASLRHIRRLFSQLLVVRS